MNIQKLIDKEMIQISQKYDNIVIDEIYKQCQNISIGVYVDKKRLKDWLEQCVYLDTLPKKEKIDLAIRIKFNNYEQEIKDLHSRIKSLQSEIDLLREYG